MLGNRDHNTQELQRPFSLYNMSVAYVRLFRPANALIAGLVAVVGAFISGCRDPVQLVLLAASGGLLISWANADNDLADIQTDKLAHPERPLASGQVSARTSRLLSWVVLLLSVLGLIPLPKATWLVFAAIFALTWSYNRLLKKIALVSSLSVALAAGAGFMFGGLAGNNLAPALWAFILASVFHASRETVKSLQDMQADRRSGRKTLPVIAGQKLSLAVATGFGVLLMILAPMPYFTGVFGKAYLIAVLVGIDALWAVLLLMLWIKRDYQKIQKIMKLDMLVALIALVLG